MDLTRRRIESSLSSISHTRYMHDKGNPHFYGLTELQIKKKILRETNQNKENIFY